MISLIASICAEIGISEWRQSHHHILKVKRILRKIQSLNRSTSKDEGKRRKEINSLLMLIKITSTYVKDLY
ncbi:MAG TPA: hypothetical protein QF571_02875 [Desulfobacterales bacterium]|nr:hypothetical protein [Desulfobacterales bacterium]